MRVKLTDRFVSTAKVTARTDYFDEANKGLALRVSEHGAKSWTFHFTDVAGKRVRLTLGTYPGMSLAAARAKVVEAKVNIADGKDPNPTKGDVGSMLDEFQARYADELRSADYVRDVIDRLVKPEIGGIDLHEIRRSHVSGMLDKIADTNGLVMADP